MRSSLSNRPAHHRHPSALALLAAAALITTQTSLVSAQASDATCYWPDGSATGENYLPCGSGATPHSTCCSRGWTCLSNGLCMAAGQDPGNLAASTIVQGGCTDRTWNTGDCPNWCTDKDDLEGVLNRAQPIKQCPRSSDRFYCELADDHQDCEDTDEYFTFAGSLTVVTTVGVTETTSSTLSSTSTTSESTVTNSLPDEITTGTAPESSETSGSSDPGNGTSSDSGPNALAIGLGVGIGVGGLGIILAVVFFILWRRRGRKAAAAAAAAGDAEDGDGGEKGAAAIGTASSPESGVSELPTTVSKNVHEASPDAMIAEAPEGDQTLGRVEAPLNEKRYEVETMEGTQGRHELAGSEVPPRELQPQQQDANMTPAGGSSGDLSPQDCSTLGASTMDASTLAVSTADDVSPVTPTNVTRKPVP